MQVPLRFPTHKTKIVCTIGPSCSSLATLTAMIEAGMNVARLNLSHGDFHIHAQNIRNIRLAASRAQRMVSILIDLPGVKMRLGQIEHEPLMLKAGNKVVLTTKKVTGSADMIPVEYKQLPDQVSVGTVIFLDDGFIQLKVEKISKEGVHAKVIIGGKLTSHKGLNLPGVKLNINPITARDLRIVEFGLKHGVNIFGLSFVESAKDIMKVRAFAKRKGYPVYLVAKIERQGAIKNFGGILKAADAVMIARGDLGVEISIEEVPCVQKRLIQNANLAGRPVITATQMLESMTHNVRPTRAEVNDVANAILDGTDAVMLSQETAVGDYPVDTVKMMAKIATTTELQRDEGLSDNKGIQISNKVSQSGFLSITDVTSVNAVRASGELNARYILTPTTTGSTARRISRFKPSCWILSFSAHPKVCEFLNLSYGVLPFALDKKITHDPAAIFRNLKRNSLVKKGDTVILTERRLSGRPGETDSLGIAQF